MNNSTHKQTSFPRSGGHLAMLVGLIMAAMPAWAHHPMGGQAPTSLFEGMASGVAHPIIGIDHFVFLLAVGLVAVGLRHRYWIPLPFVLATILGTTLHLMSVNLFLTETMVALSVVLAGALLITYNRYRSLMVLLLSAVAGVFHGYAYGEAIVGSEPTPVAAYLVGFSLVQYGAIATVIAVGGMVLKRASAHQSVRITRAMGSVVSSIGLVFLALALGST